MLAAERGAPPLMLLDDVMSELDADRRELLADAAARGGQSVITTTDLAHVPGRRRRATSTRLRDRRRAARPAGGARGMRRRRAPRPLAFALDALAAALAPPTLLAARAAGLARPPRAPRSPPRRARSPSATGSLTVTCDGAVWAQELDLMAPSSCARLNAALGAERSAAALRAAREPRRDAPSARRRLVLLRFAGLSVRCERPYPSPLLLLLCHTNCHAPAADAARPDPGRSCVHRRDH